MTADVSRQNIKDEAKSNVLITRDFLGVSAGGGDGGGSGCFGIESTELDLDLHVPTGFEKRLDLTSGKVYIQRCIPKSSSSSPPDRYHKTNFFLNQTTTTSPSPKFQDLNFQPHSKPTLNLFDEPTLDLKLISPSPPTTTTTTTTTATISSLYQSVCTLDKVKSALDRAERESSTNSNSNRKRSNNASSILSPSSLSPSNSSSNMSVDDAGAGSDGKFPCKQLVSSSSAMSDYQNGDDNNAGLLVTAACPGCLLYVLISKSNPKCPKCGMAIHLQLVTKKSRIDLNISMGSR